MTGMAGWHLDLDLAARYAGGRVAPVLAASVEQHLIGCGDCRGLLHLDPSRFEAVWSEVVERVQAPRQGLMHRLLARAGVSEETIRIVVATPILRGAWLASVIVVLVFALYAAHAAPRGVFVFLVLAPVLPLIGVAATFSPEIDPTHEMLAASPYSMIRMLALRSTFVVATTLVPTTVAALLLPGNHWVSVAWLLPSLALTSACLALAGRFPVHLSAAGLGGLWVATCVSRAAALGTTTALEQQQAVQAVSLVVLAIAAWSITIHRQVLSEQLRRHL
jgi:hypothetical protein